MWWWWWLCVSLSFELLNSTHDTSIYSKKFIEKIKNNISYGCAFCELIIFEIFFFFFFIIIVYFFFCCCFVELVSAWNWYDVRVNDSIENSLHRVLWPEMFWCQCIRFIATLFLLLLLLLWWFNNRQHFVYSHRCHRCHSRYYIVKITVEMILKKKIKKNMSHINLCVAEIRKKKIYLRKSRANYMITS